MYNYTCLFLFLLVALLLSPSSAFDPSSYANSKVVCTPSLIVLLFILVRPYTLLQWFSISFFKIFLFYLLFIRSSIYSNFHLCRL